MLANGEKLTNLALYKFLRMQINVCYAQYALYCTHYTQIGIAECSENRNNSWDQESHNILVKKRHKYKNKSEINI